MSRRWVRFERDGIAGFGELRGELRGEQIAVHTGDLFQAPRPTGEALALADVRLLAPCMPSKMIGLWRNFPALGSVLGMETPQRALYFLKANSAFADPGTVIERPPGYDGTVVFEGELAIVIGRRATRVAIEDAGDYIFGFTCINDITALDLIHDKDFPHWTRAKGFDTFGPFGPAIATGLDWRALRVRTLHNGTERQNYALADMLLSPERLVSELSHDMTLLPGDVIACGTSVGVGRLKPGATVEVEIEGIGRLVNHYAQ